jgi:proline iminopeptidase
MFGCKKEERSRRGETMIDPSKITIDIEAGGILTPDKVLLNFRKIGKGEQTLIIPSASYLFDDFRGLGSDFTLIFYDARNRGRSQSVKDNNLLSAGIWNDVQDLETIRRHFKLDKVNIVGHSYFGLVAVLYAKRYPEFAAGIIQIGAVPPPGRDYGPPYRDSINDVVQQELQLLEEKAGEMKDKDYCAEWWKAMVKMYISDPTYQNRLNFSWCSYPNEQPQHLFSYLDEHIYPSIRKLSIKDEDLQKVEVPVLAIQGKKDRIIPFAAAEGWAAILPAARLVVIEEGGHMPWVGNEETVFNSIREFLKEQEKTEEE